MTEPVFTPPPRPFLAIAGLRSIFPVNRVFCVGQNYPLHAREMGNAPGTREGVPVFFMKPADSIVHDGAVIPYPPMTQDLQHEVELVVALHKGGSDISTTKALDAVFGYTVGLDLTRRDLQQAAKAAGKPWDLGKGFDGACPCGTIIPANPAHPAPPQGSIQLSVNGSLRQEGLLADMIWPVPHLISILSRFITLKPGDLIMTGTPAGVGPLQPHDKIDAYIENIGALSVTIK